MIRLFLLFGLLYGMSYSLHAQSITVAVAANFAQPMKAILQKFEHKYPQIQTKLVIGSSGKLFAQIQQAAPFDLFLSADQEKIEQLAKLNLIDEQSVFTYAQGKLVLWSNHQNIQLNEQSLFEYKGKLAIANPKLAPYGKAAKSVLNHYQNDHINIIQANNVIGAFQYVQTQSVELGLIAKSSLNHRVAQSQYWEVSPNLYPPIKQDLAIINRKNQSKDVWKLWEFMQTQAIVDLIQSYGYQ